MSGLEQARVGELACGAGIVLHELTTHTATLEQAFLEATADSQDFSARAPVVGTAA